jgi:hypothetical protein
VERRVIIKLILSGSGEDQPLAHRMEFWRRTGVAIGQSLRDYVIWVVAD